MTRRVKRARVIDEAQEGHAGGPRDRRLEDGNELEEMLTVDPAEVEVARRAVRGRDQHDALRDERLEEPLQHHRVRHVRHLRAQQRAQHTAEPCPAHCGAVSSTLRSRVQHAARRTCSSSKHSTAVSCASIRPTCLNVSPPYPANSSNVALSPAHSLGQPLPRQPAARPHFLPLPQLRPLSHPPTYKCYAPAAEAATHLESCGTDSPGGARPA
jgi:hypothetical protein